MQPEGMRGSVLGFSGKAEFMLLAAFDWVDSFHCLKYHANLSTRIPDCLAPHAGRSEPGGTGASCRGEPLGGAGFGSRPWPHDLEQALRRAGRTESCLGAFRSIGGRLAEINLRYHGMSGTALRQAAGSR